MKTKIITGALLALSLTTSLASAADLKVYISSQHQPQVWRQVLDKFEAANPGTKVAIAAIRPKPRRSISTPSCRPRIHRLTC